MAEVAETSSTDLLKDDKPVIVRVKRKSYQSPLEAFWLEINERPVKRPLLDFEKLSINNSASKAEELKSKKFLVQHVDTVSGPDVAVDILQSFVASKPNSADILDSKAKLEDQRRSNKTDNKQKQLLVKAKETQELLAKNARFEQIWKSRKGKSNAASDDALRDMCQIYDVMRVDVGETSEVQEEEDEEDQRLMYSFLPLLHEFIPSAAEEFESEMEHQMIRKVSKDHYVYDLYAVKDDDTSMIMENASCPFPLVQVEDNDDFYDGPDNSDYETDDSNAEDNPLNDYPDEEEEEEEDDSESSNENSEEVESESSRSETVGQDEGLSEDEMLEIVDEDFNDDEVYW
ncbi:RNA-directed DNA methylation 4 [Cynara cardunculus var. scolymus]|uniref:RNA-directed DNA methylation 4 n=1 Tax=Cynara cardunculus var. scolymus TaxID=59895 RepID=UPI000D62F0C2|nr:RNA-directed DNA methylation 4 [Cynara cardunculus var. scolymus]